MIRSLLIATMLLFLAACVSAPAKDDSSASDLQALLSEAKDNLPARRLPNGKLYCIEKSMTQGVYEDCANDLEDLVWLREQDIKRALIDLVDGVNRIALTRNPCGWLRKRFRPSTCHMEKRNGND